VADVAWSRVGADDCIRVSGVSAEAQLEVRPRLSGVTGVLPPMAGAVVEDRGDACCVPRFPFVEGTTYVVTLEGVDAGTVSRPREERPATADALDIYPTAAEVPRNLLRIYVRFSAAMSEGYAADHVHLVDDDGNALAGAMLRTEPELWDAEQQRLTVLLDPARIKRGLAEHRRAGYPLRRGKPFLVMVDEGLRDARGAPLRAPVERRYQVGRDERRRVDPGAWVVTAPPRRTIAPVHVSFDRPLDRGLLGRCLRVTGPDGRTVPGTQEIGGEERSWRFTPDRAWADGEHYLVVDPVLEDLAGNSVSRVFERDLTRPEDALSPVQPVTLSFTTR
jgi:hypothetical protein